MRPLIIPIAKSKDATREELTTSSIEDHLVFGLKSNNDEAMAQLYKMYAASLMGIIIRIVKYDEVAEDVLQETFLKIWKSIYLYDSSKGRLFTWMANLAKNAAIDQIRSKHYVACVKTSTINEMPIDLLENDNHFKPNIDVIGLKRLTLNLKPDQQEIIDLFYFKGYTQIKVAEKLNIPVGTVKTKIRYSIAALRKYFGEFNQPAKLA